ncbi:MAG: 5-nucleotidase [Herbinix sp.]|nr:5-nucleotidase [Herbinix sp.]
MRKLNKFFIGGLLTVFVLIQSLYIPGVNASQPSVLVTILFTHDMHDNLMSLKAMQGDEITYEGGYARLKSAIDLEKETDPEAILVDAGDFSMGTPFQTIFQSDSPELRIMGQMGYDVVTLGNHEFDYRAEGLAESLRAAKASGDKLPQIVQSNITFPIDENGSLTPTLSDLKSSLEDYGVKDYVVKERNGVKIGIFGVMGEDSASKAPMSEAAFKDEIGNAKRVVKILKEQEKVDLIICLSHSGTWTKKSESEDEILAKEVPDINVIISGHTHTKLSEPIIVGNTVIGSCESYGKSLGVLKITKSKGKDWELNSYKLKPIDESLPEDPEITKLITVFKDEVQNKYFDQFGMEYDEVVARSPFAFQTLEELSDHHDESTLGNLISDAYIYAVKKAEGEAYEDHPVAAAIVPNGTIRGTIFQGDITTADAFSISSLGIGPDEVPGYPLISVYLTGKELKTVCEVDASITPIMGDAQLYISGMNFTFNPNRLIFNKVTDTSLIDANGEATEIIDSKLYRIVANLYSAQMLSVVGEKSYGLMSVVPKREDGTPITDYEAEIIYETQKGKQRELKEWYAVVEYLKSFDQWDGVSIIPAYYSDTQGRKVVDDNLNIIAILKNPNPIAIAVYIIVLILLSVITFIIVHFIRRSKKKRGRGRRKRRK